MIPCMRLRFALVSLLVSSSWLMGDNLLYDVTGEAVNSFGLLDANTGAYTQINTLGLGGFPSAGLAQSGGLYTATYLGGQFAQIDPTTGDVTDIGSSAGLGTSGPEDNIYYGLGSTTDDSVYAVVLVGEASADPWLYQINTSTGAGTAIGELTLGGTQLNTATTFLTLSNGGSVLYLVYDDGTNSGLYTVNVSTGAITAVGSGIADTTAGDFGGLAFLGGTLFGGSDTPSNSIYTIDPSTGAFTSLSSISGGAYGEGDSTFGLAPDVPEPATLPLTITGLAAALWIRRRSRAGAPLSVGR